MREFVAALVLASTLLVVSVAADDPQKFWPSKLLSFTHQAGGFEATNLVGRPDSRYWYPQWTAWGPDGAAVEYDTPVYATAVEVHQGRNPGVLQEVLVQYADSDPIWFSAWVRPKDSTEEFNAGTLTLPLRAPACAPGPAIYRVKLKLNTKLNNGWNGFDTVGLVGFDSSEKYTQWRNDGGQDALPACSQLWATSVTGKSSENQADQYKADKILGAPDDKAFFPLYSDYGEQTISLAFTEGFPHNAPMFLKSVNVVQYMNAGALKSVAIRNSHTKWLTVWQRTDDNAASLRVDDGTPVELQLTCMPATTFTEMQITLDTVSVKGFNGLDAVSVDAAFANPYGDVDPLSRCEPFQWASEIVSLRSQTAGWPAINMLGRPDNKVFYPIDWIEWRDWWGTDWVIVDMPYNEYITALVVNQFGGPGAVNNVYVQSEEVLGEEHKWYRLYHTQKGDTLHTERSFSIPFECIPNFKMKRIRFTIRTQMVPAYNGYDAMGVQTSNAPLVDDSLVDCELYTGRTSPGDAIDWGWDP